jgi:hypothetical protein
LKSSDLAYAGFSVKARKIIYGIEQIKESRTRAYVILLCKSASRNTKKAAANFAKNKNLPLLVTKEMLLEEIVNKKNCKAAALTDINLANALIKNMVNFETFTEDINE